MKNKVGKVNEIMQKECDKDSQCGCCMVDERDKNEANKVSRCLVGQGLGC